MAFLVLAHLDLGGFHGALSESAAEAVAAGDERLLETYFDTGYDRDLWLESLRRQAMERKLFPLTAGSALRGEGVGEALDMLCLIVGTDYETRASAPLRGVAQKVRFDDQGNKLTFVKLTQGRIRVRDEIQTPDGPAKISEIRLYHGAKYTAVPQAESGDIAALAGVQGIRPGDAVGEDCRRGSFATSPLMTAEVLWPQEIHPTRMLEILRRLEEEEPMLGVTWNEASRSIEVQVLGRIQLDVLRALVKERSGVEIDFGACRPRYMETIAGTTYGIGHYEPLRHYAEVHLRLDPLPRGSGVVFESACHVDTLALNWQRLIETHIFEKTHRGVLVGAPLTDVRVTLLTGRDHLKHTEGGDFREATYRALRNALMRGQCVLLEPVCRFDLRVPEDDFGRVMGDLNRLKAQVDPPVFSDGEAQMTGEAPFQLLSDYSESLAAMTHGRGAFSWRLDHYSPCREAEKVVAAANYNPYADGSPDSVCCAKGAGYTVAWDKVRDFAHLESEATEIVKT